LFGVLGPIELINMMALPIIALLLVYFVVKKAVKKGMLEYYREASSTKSEDSHSN